MPSSDGALTMLRRAQELELLPDSMKTIETYEGSWSGPCASVGSVDGVLFIVPVDRDEHDGVLGDLLNHLASRGLRCILEPGEVPLWVVQAPWPEAEREMREWVDSPFGARHAAPEYPDILGLLKAASDAEEWRLAREAEATDA